MSNFERVASGPQQAEDGLILVQQRPIQVLEVPSTGLFEQAQQQ
jgi:hypothetical protein